MDEPRRSLSEISHLFLSDVRALQTGGAAMPQRTPPGGAISIDLTPEEFEQACQGRQNVQQEAVAVRPVWSVMAGHLPGRAYDRARELARHLAADGQRIGLIELEPAGVRLVCFEQASEETLWQESGPASDPEAMPDLGEALEELNTDIDRWLLLIPSPRTAQGRRLMQRAAQWVLMSTCDHEGIVACYRAIKGTAAAQGPDLMLALVEAADADQAHRVFTKLEGACRQFLNRNIERGPVVQPVRNVAEHAMLFLPGEEKRNQWDTVEQFLFPGAVNEAEAEVPAAAALPVAPQVAPAQKRETCRMNTQPHGTNGGAAGVAADGPLPTADCRLSSAGPKVAEPQVEALPEVIELAAPFAAWQLIEAAVARMGLRLTDIHAPMYPDAAVTAAADGRLALVCAPHRGLAELPVIEHAWRWLDENLALVTRAATVGATPASSGRPMQPTQAPPKLKLLISTTEMNQPALRPLLHHPQVQIQTYRKLRWSGRTGILLDAA